MSGPGGFGFKEQFKTRGDKLQGSGCGLAGREPGEGSKAWIPEVPGTGGGSEGQGQPCQGTPVLPGVS